MLKIRPALPADAPDLARIQVDNYHAAYAAFYPPAYLQQFSYEEQEQDWLRFFTERPQDILLVAQAANALLAGYTLASVGAGEMTGYAAELVALHVREGCRGS